MKTKNKTKTKSNHNLKSRKKIKRYDEHYLGIILLIFLLLEGGLFSLTAAIDWQSGLSLLDMGPSLVQTTDQLQSTFAPVIFVVSGVNDFYTQATDQAMIVLDFSDTENDVALVFNSVSLFYDQASIQMSQVLDFSSQASWPAKVAGISITR